MVLNRPSSTSDDAWELVQSMTDADPGKRVSLEHVIAQLKRLAADETAIDAHAAAQAATTCSICSSEMAIDSRFCSQCGTRVDNERNSASLSSNPQSSRVDMRVDTPVPELLDAVRRGSSSDQEQALVLLLEKCLDDTQRREILETDRVGVFTYAVETCSSHFVQICAVSCLR
ncbi:hypothetical protein PC121_g15080 [Phytophthora cactorum]|nr:hypothetical protein PC121_g15080 [Phytophthora cactorum]KAG3146491.1 hypothetical protein C6341_g18000 [Phytophthora cactorum]